MQREHNASNSGAPPIVPDLQETVDQLRDENAQLRSELARLKGEPDRSNVPTWKSEMDHGIGYSDDSHTSGKSGGDLLRQLSGISKERLKAGKIRNSSAFDYLPVATDDEKQLEADFVRWGYCVVKDAMSPQQVKAQVDRLTEQAEIERERNIGIITDRNAAAQLVNNLVLKGQVFRDAVEFKENAAQGGPLVDRLLTKIMGPGFGLGCAHGSIVHEGGGLQDLHIDQGGMPRPYPPFPFGSLIIWAYTEFNLENGATYVVPGSHRDESGETIFADGADLMKLIDGEPGLVAVCAPAGSCILTDTRILHGGGQRTVPGTRYAMRCHYNRYFVRALHEHSAANHHVPDDVYEKLSERLKQMMGVTINDPEPLGELIR